MEVSALQRLLTSIDSFLNISISSCPNLNSEPLRRYYRSIEEILKLLRPVLNVITETDVATDDDLLNKQFLQLAQSVDESIHLLKAWHPLASRLIFVLEAESLITNIRSCVLEAFGFLKHVHEIIPGGLSTATFEQCTQEVESIDCGDADALISEAVKSEAAGHGLSPDKLVKMSNFLGIMLNQEIFIEAAALDTLKENAELAEKKADMEYIDQLISLMMQLHDHLIMIKHSHSSSLVPIPPDLCCPLSLDIMSDPVIVSSGQTYERAYISKWLDLGLNVCPKTRQILSRTNITPNYTVKQLIASWCEQNNLKLPDLVKSMSLNQPLSLISAAEEIVVDQKRESLSPHVRRFGKEDSLDIERESREGQQKCLHSNGYDSLSSSAEECSKSDTNLSSGDLTQVSKDRDSRRIVGSGELLKETHAPSGRRVPRIISSSAMEARPDLSPVENKVKRLLEDLNSSSLDKQREAAAELRILAKQNMDNRVVISNCGAISLLIKLLHSYDPITQENAVTTLLNLSISDNNKTAIGNAGAVEPLIHVLKTGSPEAKGNSAATLFSLSVIEENKLKIGKSGAICPLVELLANGSLSAKKDAMTALYNLSIVTENKSKIVEAGAIIHLIELMDPATGMVDKAVAALANLAMVPDGNNAIGLLGGIPILVEVVELGSARAKENAAAAILQLCTANSKFCAMALQEGVVPPIMALSQTGTARGKEKAQALLNCFKNQRQGNLGRG